MRSCLYLFAAITLVQVQAPPNGQPFVHKHLIMVVDTSGSMINRSKEALFAFNAVAVQPTDELNLKLVAFESELHTWRKDWTPLPDADALKSAATWITKQQQHGSTMVTPALQRSLAEVPDKPLTVVLVTDGIFDEIPSHVHATIDVAQSKRTVKASISVIGVGSKKTQLAQIAKKNGGGYWQLTRKKEKKDVPSQQ